MKVTNTFRDNTLFLMKTENFNNEQRGYKIQVESFDR